MDEEPKISFIGRNGSHSPNDSFFENFVSMCTESSDESSIIFTDPMTYLEVTNDYFVSFLQGCQWYFITFRTANPIDTYNYFKYIRNRFLHLKGTLFSERGGKIIHIILPNPIVTDGEEEYKCVYVIYQYINKAISILDEYIMQLTPTLNDTNPPPPPPPPPPNHGFKIKNKDCIEIAYNKLRFLAIHQDVKFRDFETAFTGWIPKNRIVWIEGPGLLSYFIKSINGKGIEDEKKSIWTTTTNCFQDKDLNNFTVEQLRFAKKPAKTDNIDKVIKVINRNSSE